MTKKTKCMIENHEGKGVNVEVDMTQFDGVEVSLDMGIDYSKLFSEPWSEKAIKDCIKVENYLMKKYGIKK
jgi:hypothetical protein